MTTMKQKAGPLQAGVAQVDITPKMGTQIAGDIGRYRPAELVNDPIYAKALVFESKGRKLCFLSLDLLVITDKWVDEIRRKVGKRFGFEPEAVMIHAVQNHSAPSLGHHMVTDECRLISPELWWMRGGDEKYNSFALKRILDAIRLASESLKPVRIGVASGIEGRVAFNRRFVMRDGTAVMLPPAGDPNIRYVEGPIDPELGVMCVSTDSLRILAMLLHYTCHPTHGYPQRYISAGWPGAWSSGVREHYGKECVPLVLNGCCGNIHHANHLDPSYVDDYRRMGRLLTETTDKVLKRITYQSETVIDWKVKHIKIPLRELDSKKLEEARNLLAKHPEPIWKDEEHTAADWKWMYALSYIDLYELRQREPEYDYEVQVFRVGDTAFVALTGEPFVEAQLRIKLESPTYPTYVAHMSNGYVGYIPTKEALKRGGYETRTAYWSKLAPEALDMITDVAVKLLEEVSNE